MPDQDRRPSRFSGFRLQFDLRTLLGLAAALALLMGMWSWRGEYGALLYFLGVSLCIIGAGVVQKRVVLVVVGLLLLLGTWYGVRYSARQTSTGVSFGWMGGTVAVRVVDARSGKPVAGATVRILTGPNLSSAAYPVQTDAQGRACVECELPVIVEQVRGVYGLHDRSWIGLSGVAVRVEAEGYSGVRVPLTDQLEDRYDATGDRHLPEATVRLSRDEGL